MGFFIQKEALSYTGSAAEFAVTLDRGAKWDIKEIRITAAAAAAGSYVQVIRKSSASTANERDSSNSASDGVLIADGYTSNGDVVFPFGAGAYATGNRNLSDTPMRLYLSLGGSSMTVYVNIVYEFSG